MTTYLNTTDPAQDPSAARFNNDRSFSRKRRGVVDANALRCHTKETTWRQTVKVDGFRTAGIWEVNRCLTLQASPASSSARCRSPSLIEAFPNGVTWPATHLRSRNLS